jgi:hypothetical protein
LDHREQLKQLCQSLVTENQKLKEQDHRIRKFRLDHAEHVLQKYNDQYGMYLELSRAAKEKLNHFEGKEKDVDCALERAVIWLKESVESISETNPVIVLEQHLQFHDEMIDIPKIPQEGKEHKKYQRTIDILDRYEKAALLIRQQNLSITGKNVGAFCPQPISPPAITDSLRKHEATIIDLCKIYPSRWNLIRKEFKPVVNLLRRYHLL